MFSVNNQRIPSLDGVRATAILMVVISHLSGAPGFLTLPWITGLILGEAGVRIFFVLSGFLITTLLLAEYQSSGRIDLKSFYIRRCFRIFPAFYIYLGALATASWLGIIILEPGDLAKSAAYLVDYFPWNSTSNFVRHIWSLSVEEQFYLIWPIAIWAFGPQRARWLAAISLIGSPVWRLAVAALWPVATLTLDRRFDAISDSLATGCLLACCEVVLAKSPEYRALLGSKWAYMLPIIVLGASAMGDHPLVERLVGYSVANIGIALFLHRCILYPPRLLNAAAVCKIGVLSYSIYLWQQAFCSEQFGSARLPAYAAVSLTFLVSAASFYVIEKPFQEFGRGLLKKAPVQPQLG